MEDNVPAPGSEEAKCYGCLCPIVDNRYGQGAYLKNGAPMYWIDERCPLHAGKEKDE